LHKNARNACIHERLLLQIYLAKAKYEQKESIGDAVLRMALNSCLNLKKREEKNMKKSSVKKLLALLTASALTVGCLAACGGGDSAGESSTDTPADSGTSGAGTETKTQEESTAGDSGAADTGASDTFIADREVTVHVYVDDIYNALPDDQASTPVWQEIKARTGIDLNITYTVADSNSGTLSAQLAAGTIPDAIVCYLNNSTRPEFVYLLKAAQDGMFADLAPYMADSKVYSKYLDESYLPSDTYNNIVFRDEFNGAAYIMHLAIPAVDHSTEYIPEDEWVGGLYIQKSIAEALDLDVTSIKTQDDLYNLLVQIRDGGFTDDNGNAVVPLGPKYWGGSTDALDYIISNYDWGVSDFYNVDENGKVLHEAETDYVYDQINFVRKLLDENLIHPEFFTMEETRVSEMSKTHGVGIIADVHNYTDIIYESDDWIPLGPLNDYRGKNTEKVSGKGGYGAWAVNADAENPEDIFRLFDYLSSEEGQLLCQYGIEGLSYNMVDGYPVVTEDVQKAIDNGDSDYLINNIGAAFGGSGCVLFDFILTDTDARERFGESRPGAGNSATFARAVEIAEDYPIEKELVPGLSATAYLSAESMADVKEQLSLVGNYREMIVQAIFASSDDEVTKIVENYRAQLKAAGIEKFEAYLEELYKEDPTCINFY